DPNDIMTLYLDGATVGFTQLVGKLSDIIDKNSWLGRSNYSVDPEFNGIFYEFRIYNAPLTANQIRASYLAGPDPAYLPYPTDISLCHSGPLLFAPPRARRSKPGENEPRRERLSGRSCPFCEVARASALRIRGSARRMRCARIRWGVPRAPRRARTARP